MGTGSGFASGSGSGRSRASLVPVSRVSRVSGYGVGNAYQPFAFPGRSSFGINEKIQAESDRSGNLGIGLSEKEIDERVRFVISLYAATKVNSLFIIPRFQERLKPRLLGGWLSENGNVNKRKTGDRETIKRASLELPGIDLGHRRKNRPYLPGFLPLC